MKNAVYISCMSSNKNALYFYACFFRVFVISQSMPCFFPFFARVFYCPYLEGIDVGDVIINCTL